MPLSRSASLRKAHTLVLWPGFSYHHGKKTTEVPDAHRGFVPLPIVEPSQSQIQQASGLKARYPFAYADAFAAQLAQEKRLPLISGDPELRILEAAGLLTMIWLSH